MCVISYHFQACNVLHYLLQPGLTYACRRSLMLRKPICTLFSHTVYNSYECIFYVLKVPHKGLGRQHFDYYHSLCANCLYARTQTTVQLYVLLMHARMSLACDARTNCTKCCLCQPHSRVDQERRCFCLILSHSR